MSEKKDMTTNYVKKQMPKNTLKNLTELWRTINMI